MLLNIYLGSIAINLATTYIACAACEKKLKREGYKIVEKEKSIPEKILNYISILIKASIPVYNILNTVVILGMGNKFYDYMERKLLECGGIYIPTEKTPSSEDEFSPREETKTYPESLKQTSLEYDEMALEEKLAYIACERNSGNKFNQEQEGPKLVRTIHQQNEKK